MNGDEVNGGREHNVLKKRKRTQSLCICHSYFEFIHDGMFLKIYCKRVDIMNKTYKSREMKLNVIEKQVNLYDVPWTFNLPSHQCCLNNLTTNRVVLPKSCRGELKKAVSIKWKFGR